eukprot:g53682.t1
MCKGCKHGFGHRQGDHWRGCDDCGGSFHRRCAIYVGPADAPIFHYKCYSCMGLQQPTATPRPQSCRKVTTGRKANPANKRDFEKCTFCSELVGLDEMVEHICSCKNYKEKYCMPEDFPFNADEKFDTIKMSPDSNGCFYRAVSYFVNSQDTSVEKWDDVRNQLVAKFLDQSLEKLNLAIEHWRDTDQSVLVRALQEINCMREVSGKSGTTWEPALNQTILPSFK